MQPMWSAQQLAQELNRWCDQHGVSPASGQAGEQISERSIRYYRTLGLVDPPLLGGGQGYGEKHRLQLAAIRLLQAQGLPLNRIRDLVFGRTLEELKRIERQGLAELRAAPTPIFRPALSEAWGVTPLDEEFLLVSRRGRGLSPELRERLLEVLHGGNRNNRRADGVGKDK
jgi:DNA-binding transcriptional MerR regulator